MPKLNDMFPSKWLKAADCDEADLILTISELRQESVGQGADAGMKWVCYFEETEKGLVLNKTNTNTIAKLYGDDTDDWEGKKIALYATEVEYQGQQSLGIRVRSRPPKVKAAAKATPATDNGDGDDDHPPF